MKKYSVVSDLDGFRVTDNNNKIILLDLARKLCELDGLIWSSLCDIDLHKYVCKAKFMLRYDKRRAKAILSAPRR